MPLCRRRSCSATTAALSTGSIGVLMTASASDQLASQPSCLRAISDDDRRAVVDLVLELPGQSHAAGGLGLAVEDRDVDAALVELALDHVGVASRTRPSRSRPVSGAGRRPTAVRT